MCANSRRYENSLIRYNTFDWQRYWLSRAGGTRLRHGVGCALRCPSHVDSTGSDPRSCGHFACDSLAHRGPPALAGHGVGRLASGSRTDCVAHPSPKSAPSSAGWGNTRRSRHSSPSDGAEPAGGPDNPRRNLRSRRRGRECHSSRMGPLRGFTRCQSPPSQVASSATDWRSNWRTCREAYLRCVWCSPGLR